MEKQNESTLLISGRTIPISILRKRQYRRCTMKMSDEILRVTVPLSYSDKLLDKFINSNSDWILKHYCINRSRVENLPQLIEGGKIPFKGEFYHVKLTTDRSISFIDNIFYIPDVEWKYDLLTEWYIKESLKFVSFLLEHWNDRLGKGLKEINLKNMSSRWGSCSSKGNISLNWKLILAPREVFQYVFIHELCHLQIKSHASDFWDLVETYAPNVKQHRLWLRKRGFLLSNFPKPISTSAIVGKIKEARPKGLQLKEASLLTTRKGTTMGSAIKPTGGINEIR